LEQLEQRLLQLFSVKFDIRFGSFDIVG